MDIVEDYIETGKALQRKYDEIRQGFVTQKSIFEQQFKPILEPLRKIEHHVQITHRAPSRKKISYRC